MTFHFSQNSTFFQFSKKTNGECQDQVSLIFSDTWTCHFMNGCQISELASFEFFSQWLRANSSESF